MPTVVGQEVPATGREGSAVGLAWAIGLLVGVAVGVAVAVAVGVALGVAVGLPVGVGVGEPDGIEIVKVRALQDWGGAAWGTDSGAVGATACCLS